MMTTKTWIYRDQGIEYMLLGTSVTFGASTVLQMLELLYLKILHRGQPRTQFHSLSSNHRSHINGVLEEGWTLGIAVKI